MFNIPMSKENFEKEWKYIKDSAKINGFDDEVIWRIFKKHERKFRLSNVTTLNSTPINSNEFCENVISIPFHGSLTENLRRKLSKYGVKIVFKNQNKLSDLLGSMKDQEKNAEKKSGVYIIDCDDCDAKYIGMTKRRLEKRFNEHLNDCKKPLNPESAMAFHCITNGHKMNNEIKLLKEIDEPHKLSVWESMLLYKNRRLNLTNLIKEGNSPSILYEILEIEENFGK
jgi:hypothetical protein